MGRNYLIGQPGDAANAILAAVGYNFRLPIAWLAELLCALLAIAIADQARASSRVYASG